MRVGKLAPNRMDEILSMTAGRFGWLSTGRALGWGAWGQASILSGTETPAAEGVEADKLSRPHSPLVVIPLGALQGHGVEALASGVGLAKLVSPCAV